MVHRRDLYVTTGLEEINFFELKQCRYAQCHYAECRHAECRITDTSGIIYDSKMFIVEATDVNAVKRYKSLIDDVEKWAIVFVPEKFLKPSRFDHLVSQVKTTVLAPYPFVF